MSEKENEGKFKVRVGQRECVWLKANRERESERGSTEKRGRVRE